MLFSNACMALESLSSQQLDLHRIYTRAAHQLPVMYGGGANEAHVANGSLKKRHFLQ